jgi:hypothetical protein
MKFSTLILIGICSLALAVPALAQDVQDESGERSLENVIVQTLKTNPDLHAAKAEYNAVYETLDQGQISRAQKSIQNLEQVTTFKAMDQHQKIMALR